MKYKPKVKCPHCRSYPNIRFSADAVREARRQPQRQRVQELTCQNCGKRYWLENWAIINAIPDGANANGEPPKTVRAGFPPEIPKRAARALEEAGIRSLEDLLVIDDLAAIPGIGPGMAKTLHRLLEMKGLTRPVSSA